MSLATDILLILSYGLTFSKEYYSYEDIHNSNSKSSQASLRVTLSRLVKRGYIEKISRNGIVCFKLTSQGKKNLADMYGLEKVHTYKWDGKWRVIVLKKTNKRKLKDLGFGKIQNGVYISPFPLREKISSAFVFETKKTFPFDVKELADQVWKLTHLANRYQAWIGKVAYLPGNEKEIAMFISDFAENPGVYARDEGARGNKHEKTFHKQERTTGFSASDDKRSLHLLDENLLEKTPRFSAGKFIAQYQKIVRDDPRLPFQLLPRPWPASLAASVFAKLVKRRFGPK